MGGTPLTPGAAPRSSRPTWLFWVLGGCLLFVMLIVGSIVGVYYWTKSKLTAMVEEQSDPVQREQGLKAMLGAQTLPPGYHARWAVWFQRVEPSIATAHVARAGSVMDESAMRAFFSHFRICN